MHSKVSTIVPVYNGARRLQATVNSLLAQTYASHEIILINDGSTDESRDLIEDFSKLPNVISVHQKNAGVAAARNAGISVASGELLAFCDQDDQWLPHKLETQVPLFVDGIGLIYSGVEFKYPNMSRTSIPQGQPTSVVKTLQVNTICSCTAMARKDLVEQVGMFEADRALMGVDDWHLWIRLLCVTRAAYAPSVLAVHVVHENNYSHKEANMLDASIACLDSLSKDPKIIAKQLDINLAKENVFEHYAKNMINNGDFDGAVKCLIHRFKLNPRSPANALKIAFFGMLPNKVLHTIQRTYRTLR